MQLTPEIQGQLKDFFDPLKIQWKPQSTNREKTRALAVSYVNPREYEDRLNEVVPGDWHMRLVPVDKGQVMICELTICGVTRSSCGEEDLTDQNTATSAEAQAFKRACVKFGLGRYLYNFPKMWDEYDKTKKRFTDASLKRLAATAAGEVYVPTPAPPEPEPAKPAPAPAPAQPAQPAEQPAATPTQPEAMQPTQPAPAPAQPAAPAPATPAASPTGTAPTGVSWADRDLTQAEMDRIATTKEKLGIKDNQELGYWVLKWDAEVKDKLPAGMDTFWFIKSDVEGFCTFIDRYYAQQGG